MTQYERTKPLYPTDGPGDGRTWNEYFREAKGRIEVDPDAEPVDEPDDDLPGPITVTVPGHEVTEGWPNALNTWRTRALANDWRVRMGHSAAHDGPSFFKNGNPKPEHDIECWWMDAMKNGVVISITYYVRDGENYSSWTSRRVKHEWFTKYSDKAMQALIKGEQ